MRHIPSLILMAITLAPASAGAQIFVGPGSTPEGDYLRGVGMASWGMGQYNLNTARAESIRVDAAITLDSYIGAVRKEENARQARIRAQKLADHLKYWHGSRERLRDAPNAYDISIGNALNDLMGFVSQGKFTPSELRSTSILLPADVVRRLPFKLGEEGAVISLPRMKHEGIGAWPVAYQDKKYTRVRETYDRAIKHALDEQYEGRISQKTMIELDQAVGSISRQLELDTFVKNESALYNPAIKHLRELEKSATQLKSHKIERVTSDLDAYMGTTVDELRKFMNDHKLSFAIAERPEEVAAYREIYALLASMRASVEPGTKDQNR